MKQLTLQTNVTVCQLEELSPVLRELVETAKAKTQDAYCPYSHYHVGAAALLSDGQVITGSNQENAAYPSGLCAERTTLFAANANNPHTPVEALAIACYTNGHFTKDAASPCGACRQVMLETEHRFGKDMKVILYGEDNCYVFERAADLLPLNFVAENLQG
ncbi:MAG: cytidine deaminase [Paludibacteraceae bacterium]|nr:cytidine deaminase [Paludibacteraceae bacterium]MBQ9751801.1 cytidine deaminase [Paludibacteraceae bacterium]